VAPCLQRHLAGAGDVDLGAPVFRGRPRAAARRPALVHGTDRRAARRVWRVVFPAQHRSGGRRRRDRSADFAVPIVARTLFPTLGHLLRRDRAGWSDPAADGRGSGQSGHAHPGTAPDGRPAYRNFHRRGTAARAKRSVRQTAILRRGAAQYHRRGAAHGRRLAEDVHQYRRRDADLTDGRMDDARTQKGLAALERSARAQATVMDDLLDISQIIRGKLRLAIRRTNLPDVLNEAVETVEPAVRAKSIDLRMHVDADVSTI